MKLPEYLLSTPRLILVLLTLGLLIFVAIGKVDPTVFKDIALVVFGYFFGSRGQEQSGKTPSEQERHEEQ